MAQVHDAEGAHQRQRHGHTGNDGGAQAAQKQVDHGHHQQHAQRQGELDVVHRGTHGFRAIADHVHIHALGQGRVQAWQQCLHPVGHLDDVGPGLAPHADDDGALAVGPARQLVVLHPVDDVGHFLQADGRAVAVGQDQRPEAGRTRELIVGGQGVVLARTVQVAFGLIDVGGDQDFSDVVQAESSAGQRRGVNLHAHRRLLTAVDGDQPHARHLRDLLRQDRIRYVVDLVERQGVRADAQGEDGRVGRVALAVGRWRRERRGQQVRRRVNRSLHVLLGRVDVAIQIELQRDLGVAEARYRGHLAERRHLAELSFERRGHRRGHGLRTGSRQRRGHHDGGIVHLGQRGHGKLAVTEQAGQQQPDGQQRCRHRTPDERLGYAHCLSPRPLPPRSPEPPGRAPPPPRPPPDEPGSRTDTLLPGRS